MEKCPKCNQQIEESFNFCPYCSEPLNDLANDLQTEKEKAVQLSLLFSLIQKTDNPKILQTYKSIVESISAK